MFGSNLHTEKKPGLFLHDFAQKIVIRGLESKINECLAGVEQKIKELPPVVALL